MTFFSFRKAVEYSGTSKSAVIGAIRSGKLSAARTDRGGFAIDPAELFRVFPLQQLEQLFAGQKVSETASVATAAPPAATDELALRFAALDAGLKELYAVVQSRGNRRQEANDTTPNRRPWWKRLAG